MPLPNSLPWMESVDAKMIRAHEHLHLFIEEVDQYLSTIHPQPILKSAPGRPNPCLMLIPNDYIPPIRLSAIAGDCIHNMRSALDNLICGLAITEDRACNCKDTKFPYTENEADWIANSPSRLKGIPAKALPILRDLQPWCNATKPNPLLMLNKLSNMDKHRHCAFGLAFAQDATFRIACIDGSAIEIWPKGRMFLGDVLTFDVPVPTHMIANPARFQASGTFVINFSNEGPWGKHHVSDVLFRCFDYIEKRHSSTQAILQRVLPPSNAT